MGQDKSSKLHFHLNRQQSSPLTTNTNKKKSNFDDSASQFSTCHKIIETFRKSGRHLHGPFDRHLRRELHMDAPSELIKEVCEAVGVQRWQDIPFAMDTSSESEPEPESQFNPKQKDENSGTDDEPSEDSSQIQDSSSIQTNNTGRRSRPGKTATHGATSQTDAPLTNNPVNSAPSSAAPKIANQVPITTFWSYIELFFKAIDEADLKYLDDPTMPIDAVPFVIPPLGRRYEQQWRDLYGFIVQTHKRTHPTDGLHEQTAYMPSLSERILSMLREEHPLELHRIISNHTSDEDKEEEVDEQKDYSKPDLTKEDKRQPLAFDHIPLTDRLVIGLRQAGLQNLPLQAKDYHEDDAICEELRACQVALREQLYINHFRKNRLAARIRKHLPCQEYYAILLEIDKQIDSAFQRRLRAAKKRKRPAAQTTVNEDIGGDEGGLTTFDGDIHRLVEDRNKLVRGFANVFPGQLEALLPQPSPLIDPQGERKYLERVAKEGEWLPLPPIDLPSLSTPTTFLH